MVRREEFDLRLLGTDGVDTVSDGNRFPRSFAEHRISRFAEL